MTKVWLFLLEGVGGGRKDFNTIENSKVQVNNKLSNDIWDFDHANDFGKKLTNKVKVAVTYKIAQDTVHENARIMQFRFRFRSN